LEIPVESPGVGIERECGTREQRLVAGLGASADAQPGFGFGRSPIGDVETGIVTADDPRITSCAQEIGQLAPSVTARLAFARDGAETPELFAGTGVVGADVAV